MVSPDWTPLGVQFTRRAEKDLRRAGKPVAARIRRAVRRFARTGEGDVRKLFGAEGEARLRVGDWRVIFTVSSEGTVRVLVLRVRPRGEAYSKKSR